MKQTIPVSEEHRCGCHSNFTGTRKRGGTNTAILNTRTRDVIGGGLGPAHHAQVKEPVTTDWLDIPCGHDMRATDPGCRGCVNRGDGNA